MAPSAPASADDLSTILTGNNAGFITDVYTRYLADPGSVAGNWKQLFDELGDEAAGLTVERDGPSWTPRPASAKAAQAPAGAEPSAGASAADAKAAALDSIRALMLIRAYRTRGHLYANLDPLGLKEITYHPELDPATYGFTDADYDRPIFINHVLGLESATLGDIEKALRKIYAGKIGVEFTHITDPEQKSWLQKRIENLEDYNRTEFTDRGRRAILDRLIAAEQFEKFLDVKYKGTKRFGLDGGEAMIPALEQILKRGSQLGLEEVVVGMPHRGRLNVLANFMGKPYRAIFSEFAGMSSNPDGVQGSGDVKYHLGTSTDRSFDDKSIHLSLTANPSHLEAVNPVVVGKVRAKQAQRKDTDRTKVMALLLHGDAAFAGQGLVPETLDLSELKGYRIGGTIHFVVNNQIGFTTNPVNARSGPYCTEVAKIIEAPIFHVNGDDPEAVVHVARVATEFRQTFKKDVIIDMFCYRRFGHNEGDEPAFTQPQMYQQIRQQVTVQQKYGEKLVKSGMMNEDQVEADVKSFKDMLTGEFDAANSFKPNKADWLEGKWTSMSVAETGPRRGKTAITGEAFERLGKVLSTIPDNFNANSKLKRLFAAKQKMFETGQGFDWGTAESLAFAGLLDEGSPIRFSGQDVRRGTFSHRHAVLVDQVSEDVYLPLNNIREGQAELDIVNSPLSELAVLGFEYGYSLAEPMALTLWEAQFGDFSNGAQIIIDQFIASGESKWLRMSGLVMLLPHGYEGQGPEHSSARPERFLQLCGEDNMQVVNCTTPANYFHVLRRQMKRDFRKPLIVFTPKSLLRHKMAVSERHDFTNGSCFHRVLYDNDRIEKAKAKRVVMCAGKVYYDLKQTAIDEGRDDVYFLRLEQQYPFPSDALAEELRGLEHCDMVWCQEEPKNMGCWSFVQPFIEDCLTEIGAKQSRPKYVGRVAAASPATGSAKRHAAEQQALVSEALSGDM